MWTKSDVGTLYIDELEIISILSMNKKKSEFLLCARLISILKSKKIEKYPFLGHPCAARWGSRFFSSLLNDTLWSIFYGNQIEMIISVLFCEILKLKVGEKAIFGFLEIGKKHFNYPLWAPRGSDRKNILRFLIFYLIEQHIQK